MNSLNIKTGDKVQVISGADKGKQGKIVTVSAKENKVIVEGVNMVTKHVKPKQAGQLGGRVQALCVQGSARLPQVRQAYKSRSQD